MYYVLDDTDGAPYPIARRPEFQPMLSFGYGGSWIHGYPHLAGTSRNVRAGSASTVSALATHK